MGDVLHAMPAVAALRAAHPEWFIGWVIEPRWLPLLQAAGTPAGRGTARPLVDETYLAATREWKKRPLAAKTLGDIAGLRRRLRSERFDLCIDMQGSIRSAVIGHMANAGMFTGPEHPREGPARWLYRQRVQTHAAHVVEQGCEIVGAAVGELVRPAKIELPVDSLAEESCRTRLHGMQGARGLVLIAPGAGWGAKQWPAERYGAVAAILAEAGYRALVNAYSAEDALANEVVRASGGHATVLPCGMAELIALTRRVDLVIAGDTGPLHLAAALERPVVALFGPTDPARNGPYGTESRVLRHGGERRDHRRLAEPEVGLLAITVDEVVAAALDLLKGTSGADRVR
ncbi:MAG: glycosyl transferase [Acidobacteria bacterium]|nr:glycosyl transferase [Acidobacteriota bacterium]